MKITRTTFKRHAEHEMYLINAINTLRKSTQIRAAEHLMVTLKRYLEVVTSSKIDITVVELLGKPNNYRFEFEVLGQFEIWYYPESRRWTEK